MKKVDENVELNQEEIQVEDKKKKKKEKKKKNIVKIIFNTIVTILFVVVLLNAVIGMINMQKINNDEQPIWYLDKETIETDLKTVTKYNLGIYKIVKTDTAKETKTTLQFFFLAE